LKAYHLVPRPTFDIEALMFGDDDVAAAATRRGAFNVALALTVAPVWKGARCIKARDVMIWVVLKYVARKWRVIDELLRALACDDTLRLSDLATAARSWR